MAALASRVAKLERLHGPQQRPYGRVIMVAGDGAENELSNLLSSEGIERKEDDLVIHLTRLTPDPSAVRNPEIKAYPFMPLTLGLVTKVPR